MDSEESLDIEIKQELHEEVTSDDNEGALMDASAPIGTVKLEDKVKKELREAFANEIYDSTKYLCELCKCYFPNLSFLYDHMQNHDDCDEKINIKRSNDGVNSEDTKNTEEKKAFVEGNHIKKPDDKQEEKCNEKKNKRQRTEEKDDGKNFVNDNDNHELVKLITMDHIILRKKHHDGIVDKVSFKTVKEEAEDVNDNDELVNLIMQDHIILRTNHHDGNTIKMETEVSEETSQNSMCEKSNFRAETADGKSQIENEFSEAGSDTVMNVGDAYDGRYKENASKCLNNTKIRKELVSKELATENIPPDSSHVLNQDERKKRVNLTINETKNIQSPNQKFDCNECSKSFETRRKLYKHKICTHKKQYVFCEVCQKMFLKYYIKEHVKRVHLGVRDDCECTFCGKIYKNRRSFADHTKQCSKNKTLDITKRVKCDLCKKTFVSQESLDVHKADHKKFICDYCDRVCYHKFRLAEHIKRVHLKVRYRCKKCGNVYAKLYKHMKTCNKNIPPEAPHTPNQFDCQVCCRSFETSKKLKVHKYNSHRRQSAFCDVCQKKYRKSYLNEHIERVHSGIKVESFVSSVATVVQTQVL